MLDNISLPEYIWLFSSLVGWVLTGALLVDAIGDLQVAKIHNSVRETIASGRVHSEIWRLAAHTMLLGMAIRAADSPLGQRLDPAHLTGLSIFRAEYVLSVVAVTMMIGSAISWRTKYQVRHALALEELLKPESEQP